MVGNRPVSKEEQHEGAVTIEDARHLSIEISVVADNCRCRHKRHPKPHNDCSIDVIKDALETVSKGSLQCVRRMEQPVFPKVRCNTSAGRVSQSDGSARSMEDFGDGVVLIERRVLRKNWKSLG